MKLLLKAHSSDEHYNAEIEWVFVDITKELAQVILKRAKAFKKLMEQDKNDNPNEGGLLEVYYWDHHALYLKYEAIPEEQAEEIWNEGNYVETDKSYEEGERTECDQMIISEDYVTWTCIPKHTDIHITSEQVSLSEIEKMI